VLSPREREVLQSLSVGLTNDEIALRLGVSIATVKTHLASAYNKLGVRNRVEAVMLASHPD
jgi:DNA-binding CsgD family transcriptional regulator